MISNFSPGMHLACLFAEWLRESGRTFDELLRRNVLPPDGVEADVITIANNDITVTGDIFATNNSWMI